MKKYSMKPRKRNNRKTRKRSRKRGGVILGQGSFGTVASPAYPCDVEDIPHIDENVSKIAMNSNSIRELKEEMNNAGSVRKFKIPGDMTGTIDDYFLLPSKLCKMKLQKELLREINTSENKKELKKKLLQNIFRNIGKPWATSNAELQTYISSLGHLYYNRIRNNFFSMLIMPKADMDLYNRFVKFPNNYINNIVILQNIANGIKILQMNDYCHNDLKLSNCVYHNEKGKIIDLSMMFNILSYNQVNLTRCFSYGYPSIDCYEYYFMENPKPEGPMTHDSLKTLLKKSAQTLKNDINSNINFDFLIPPESTYHVEKTCTKIERYIQTMLKKLILQKTFGITDEFTASSRSALYEYIISNYNRYDEHVNGMLTYFFDILSTKNFDKLDFYKRYDIYSFGLMLYNFLLVSVEPAIKKYLAGMYYPTVRRDQDSQHLQNQYKLIKRHLFAIIFELYKLVFYCCYQTYEFPDINHIIEYMEIITKGFTMPTTSTIIFDDDVDPLIYIQEIHEQNGTIEKYNNSQINILFYSVNSPDNMQIDNDDV
jgi:serine/threonine protein kinase